MIAWYAVTLRSGWTRAALFLLAVPVAILLNGIRIFLTGFLVLLVDPKLGQGFMHITEGWLIFVIAFFILGGIAWLFMALERRVLGPERPATEAAHG